MESKLRSIKKKTKKLPPPMYITKDGYVYERIGKETESVLMDIDLDEDLLKKLQQTAKDDNFISINELIRHIIREQMQSCK